MDINNHLKHINLDSIKRERIRPEPKLISDPKIMNIAPTEKVIHKGEARKKTKIQSKIENAPPKIGFWSKLLSTLKQIIFRK